MRALLLLLLAGSAQAGIIYGGGPTDALSAATAAGTYVQKAGDTMTGRLTAPDYTATYGLTAATGSFSGGVTASSVTSLGAGEIGGTTRSLNLDITNGIGNKWIAFTSGGKAFDYASLKLNSNALELAADTYGSNFMFTGMKVGIGTASPGAALHVVGSEILTSSLTVGGSAFVPLGGAAANGIGVVGTGDKTIMVQGGTSGAVETAMRSVLLRGQFGTTTNHQASMIQNGVEHITIPAGGGKVGILTITPATVLDVEGNAQFGSGAAKSTFTATGNLTVDAAAYITVGSAKVSSELFASTSNSAYLRAGSGSGSVHINDGSNGTTYISEAGTGAVRIMTATGTQLYYCSGGTYDGHIGRGASMVCTGGTATALGIYVP